jgi:uncharacterized protein (DUF983 family)
VTAGAARPVNRCPHCGAEPCLPLWRKFTLGPSSKAHCRVCDCLVGVEALRASAAMLPTFLLIVAVATGLLQVIATMIVLLGVTVAAMLALYASWVPLMPEQLSSPTMIEAGRARRAVRRRGEGGR